MFLLLYVMIAFLKKINHYNTHTFKLFSGEWLDKCDFLGKSLNKQTNRQTDILLLYRKDSNSASKT